MLTGRWFDPIQSQSRGETPCEDISAEAIRGRGPEPPLLPLPLPSGPLGLRLRTSGCRLAPLLTWGVSVTEARLLYTQDAGVRLLYALQKLGL